MRATSVTNHDTLEALEQGSIRNIEAKRPINIYYFIVSQSNQFTRDTYGIGRNGLELHDSDPTRPLTVAWAQPDIVGVGEPDFEGAVRS